MPTLARSFVAIVVGYMVMMLAVIVLTLIMVKTMGLKSGHPTPGYLAINAIYSFLAAAIGGFVTASIAQVKPMQHAAVLAGVMFLMGIVSYMGYAGMQPRWYQLTMMIVPSLCALAGASLQASNAPKPNR